MPVQIDIDLLRAQWIADFGGDYPVEFVERYVAFIETMIGLTLDAEALIAALARMEGLPKDATDQLTYYRNMHKVGEVYEQCRIEAQKIIGFARMP